MFYNMRNTYVLTHYIGPSKQFEPYSIDPRRNISSKSFLVISHTQNFSGQTLVVFNLLFYLLGNSGLWIRIRIQYLSIWALTSPRPNTHEFWTSAPTRTNKELISILINGNAIVIIRNKCCIFL